MEVLLSSVEVALSVGSTAVIIENIHKGRSLTTKEQVLAQILLDDKKEKKEKQEEEEKKQLEL